MADAEESYRIAEARIAEAKATGAKALNLSPFPFHYNRQELPGDEILRSLHVIPPTLSDLTALTALCIFESQVSDLKPVAHLRSLTFLQLVETRVADLAPLAELTKLTSLDLSYTPATDISPLAGMTELKMLDLAYVPIDDLSPLAGMTKLESLNISGTKVVDFAPLADSASLLVIVFQGPGNDPLRLVAPGSPWENEDAGLYRVAIDADALGDQSLRTTAERLSAPALLARLREIRDERASPSPPAFGPDDWGFETTPDGRLRLSDESLGSDADQAAVQDDLRRRAEALARSLAGSNEFAALAEDARGYAALLSRPASEIGAKAVWALSCIFRAALAADEAAEREGRLNDQLPPLARAALTNVVTIGGAWLLDHPGVAEVEAKARNWRATQAEERETEAALAVLTAIAAEPGAVEPETARTLSALARLGQGSKAVLDATRGLVVFLLRTAWKGVKLTAGGLILIGGLDAGVQVALRLIATHEATVRALLAASSPDALRFFDALVRAIGL